MVAESVDRSRIGSAYGLIQAMDSAGAILGPLAALALIGHFGMRGVFWAAAVPGGIAILVAWLGIQETRSADNKSRAGTPTATDGDRRDPPLNHSKLSAQDAPATP